MIKEKSINYKIGKRNRYEIYVEEELAGYARLHEENYICLLFIKPRFRKQKLATKLIEWIAGLQESKLNRCPVERKNDKIVKLSATLNSALFID